MSPSRAYSADMIIKEITVGAAHTLNLGNYQSMRVEASMTVIIPEGFGDTGNNAGNFDMIKIEAQTELRRLLEETYKAQRKKDHHERDYQDGEPS